MRPPWFRRPRLPSSLRKQFEWALLGLALLVVAGGLTAVLALHTTATAARSLAEERLLRMEQAQQLVQQAMLIERESRRLLATPDRAELQHNYTELIERLSVLDAQLDGLGSTDLSVLSVHAAAQSLRSAAHVVVQLRDNTLRADSAFDQAMAERSRLLSDANEEGLEGLAAVLLRLHGANRGDEVMELMAGFLREANALADLPPALRADVRALQRPGSGDSLEDPFSLRIALITYRDGIGIIDQELQRHVGAIVEATQHWSDHFTEDYRYAMQALADGSNRSQMRVAAWLSASLVLAWAVARFFLGQHVIARLQTVSRFLRQSNEDGPEKVPVRGHDEIGQMARAVEQFIAARRQLARLNEALAEAKRDLEHRVEERTEDLRTANFRLQAELNERRRAEAALASVNRSLRMLSDSNQTLIHASDERALLEDVCRILVSVGGYAVAWVGLAEQDSDDGALAVVTHARSDPASLAALHQAWRGASPVADPVGIALRSGDTTIVRAATDTDTDDSASMGWPDVFTEQGYRAFIALPLKSPDRSFGVLCTCAAAHDAFDTCETAILEELAGDLAFGIVTLRARAEHARAEAALARSERHLRSIYEHSPLAYQALDAEGRYTEVNAAWCAMMGRAREDVLGTRHAAHLLPESAAGLQALLADINAIDELHGIEFEVRHPDGRRLEVELDIKTGRDESGRRPELHCLLHDITQRKATERVLMHHAAIIASSDDAIIGESLDGMITSWNSGAERMFGHLRDEVVGRPITLLVPDALHDEEVMIRRRIMQGTTVSHYQTVRLRKDGSQIEVSVTVSPLRDGNGALVGASLIARDITEQKLAEQELRLAATAFESKEGMFITDADANILRVNRAFTEITGFGAEDCIGRKPFMAESACQEAAFHADMWETLRRDGAWAGEIWNQRKNGERYPEWRSYTAVRDDAGEITHFVGTITDITQRKAAEEEIRELAFYDQLTRLPNRRLLMDRLKQAMAASSRSGRQGALLFIDLDNFKTLNDTSGHDIGDLLLKQVAQRLVECVREGDTVARIGGDEFVVMLEGLSAESHEAAAMAQVVGDKIIATLNRPYLLAGHEHRSTPSIGAALFIDSVISLDELLKQADIAMYQAKSGGRNTLRFFNPEMQAALTARARLEADLRHGLVDEQFLLHFQSQVDQDDRVTGAEVLLRWQHPLHGTVPPSEFIPLAEDTGLILPLGRWVLESACRQLAAWASQPELAHLRLAVNVSPRQFHQRDFVDQVRQALAGSGADPRLLELELTESLLLEDVEDTVQKMTALKREGLRFSLDDFGTGYSSLSYLKRLPLDQLKIDQSFVHDVLIDGNDAAIAKTIVALARSLGLDVIAEGVETLEQRDFLARQDCRAYQGYLFGRPLPIREFERFAAITTPS